MANNGNIDYNELNRKLFSEYTKGDISKKREIIETNINLVKLIVKRYFSIYGIPYDDLFQEGCCALIEAIDKFNPNKGYKFSAYASKYIIGQIKTYLNKNKKLHIPPNTLVKTNKYKSLRDKNLSDEEIAKEMKLSLDELEKVKNNMQIIDNISVISIDTKIFNSGQDDDKDLTIADLCASSENVDIAIDNVFRKEILQKMSKILTEREMKVVCMTFGFYGDCMTEKSVADTLNTSRPNISRIKREAIKKLSLNNSFKIFNECI